MRIRFTKKESARFISHLDLMRTMTRALTRAHIPVKITQGFNPHPYLVFSVPLPLGIASDCELLDFGLSEPMTSDEVRAALATEMPLGLDVTAVYEPSSSLNDIAFADYRLFIPGDCSASFNAFLSRDSITVSKRSKKGPDKVLDLKPDVRMISAEPGTDGITVILRLPCGNQKNIGINLLLDAYYRFTDADAHTLRAERIRFLDQSGSDFN